jgi:hypothetical protein
MVMPLSISIPIDIDAEDIADCMAEFMDEALDARAALSVELGSLFQAIVTGGAEGDIIGTIDVMVAEELCASAAGAKATTALMIVE